MSSSLQVLDTAINDIIHTDFEIQTLAGDCEFTEGPLWNKEGYYLFSDINANTIYKISEETSKEVFIKNSGTDDIYAPGIRPDHAGSNALAYDVDGNLLICQHGNHGLARWTGNTLQPVVNTYNGRTLNSPNDLIVANNGRVFFSDPPYGLTDAKPNPQAFQPSAVVYCWENGLLTPVCDKYQYPNGVCITPDGKELYICSNKPFEKFISVYDVATLQYKKILAEENSDGIKCDASGNVWLCAKEGLVVLNSQGKRLAVIELATIPANICWGGVHLKDLFITARENIFLIKNLLK